MHDEKKGQAPFVPFGQRRHCVRQGHPAETAGGSSRTDRHAYGFGTRGETDIGTQEFVTRINHDIPQGFTVDAVAEAAELTRNTPPPPETHGTSTSFSTGAARVDLGDLPFVTIDGEDAKDFDDAVCVEPDADGLVLWVAIADVSFYVHPRSAIDTNALQRGNSYYFPASVTPMLPEILCNDLCSLRPGRIRPVMAVRLHCRPDGTVQHADFSQAVIRSRARLTYEGVQAHYDGTARTDGEIGTMLDLAKTLAEAMIAGNAERGALDLDIPEAAFTIGHGRVEGVGIRKRLFAHRLIEAFMIAANEAVASFLTARGVPFPLRAHPMPDRMKFEELLKMLRNAVMGTAMPAVGNDPSSSKTLAAILTAAKDIGKVETVSRLALRSMARAVYVPGPTQARHYGLASDCYCHFTSPIRRYADLMTHRALKLALGVPEANPVPAGQKLNARCTQCNERERVAQDAEREITKRLVCQLLRHRIGDVFDAVVTGVLDFGFFAEPKGFPADGLVRISDMNDDWYDMDASGQMLRGTRTGRHITVGDVVRLRLISVSVDRMQIDFVPAEGNIPSDMAERKAFRDQPRISTNGRTARTGRSDRHGHDGRKKAKPTPPPTSRRKTRTEQDTRCRRGGDSRSPRR